MIVYTKEFKARCKEVLSGIDFNSTCVEVYTLVKAKHVPLPLSEESDLIESMVYKRLINELIRGWVAGCTFAQFDPVVVQDRLEELDT